MEFRRSGQRDGRRRRVLNDGYLTSAARRSSGSKGDRRKREAQRPEASRSLHYGDAEFMDEQFRLTDLVPSRLGVYLAILVVGLGIVAGLEGLYLWMPRLAAFTSDGRVAAFDLDGEGSLAVWFSSMTLAAAGLVAVLVFTVRRHRKDDYQGRYRVWLWAAMCFTLMSLDETASLHEGFKEMMTLVTGSSVFGDGSIWWVTAYFFLLGAVGTRLVVDMRECFLSTATILAAAACYLAAVGAQLGFILPESGARGIMVEEGAEMVANLLLLLAMGLHARHVILDAQGLLSHGEDAEDADEENEEDEWYTVDREIAVHPPHGVPRPSPKRKTPQRVRESQRRREEEIFTQLTAPVSRKLSKAEKKALRRKLEKMKRKREGR